MGRRLILAGLAGLLLGGAVQVSSKVSSNADRVFASTKDGELSAELPNRPNWCRADLTFTIRGREDDLFTGDRVLLQKLLGVVRIGLESECPRATSVTFNGFVDDVFVYRGYASRAGKEGQWLLLTMPIGLVQPPKPPQPVAATAPKAPPAPRPESIAECDAAGAHPDDPEKPENVQGVSDDYVNAGKALAACGEAIQVEPENTRIKFQLARAYLLYDKPVEGVELMTEAAEEGHGAAIAALGDFALYGVLDDEPDPEMAKALYEQAAEAGFQPAAKLAAEIVADPKEDTTQQAAQEPVYLHPDRLAVLLQGRELPGDRKAFTRTLVYALGVIGGIQHHCPDAGLKASPDRVMTVVSNRVGGGGMLGGMTGLMDLEAHPDLDQAGMDDGYALAFTKGCDSKDVLAVHESLNKTFE
jgi:hypothetical protein